MWSIIEKRGRRLGAGNRVAKVGAHLLTAYSAHSLKDNYSFAIDLKISEILASAKPFPVEKYRAGVGVGEKVPRKGDASGCEEEKTARRQGGREGGKGVPK